MMCCGLLVVFFALFMLCAMWGTVPASISCLRLDNVYGLLVVFCIIRFMHHGTRSTALGSAPLMLINVL
jgi:hypothetical protein